MNERDLELADQCTAQEFSDCTGFSETFDKEKFADLIRADEREALCKAMKDQNTWNWDDPADTAIQVIRARGNT